MTSERSTSDTEAAAGTHFCSTPRLNTSTTDPAMGISPSFKASTVSSISLASFGPSSTFDPTWRPGPNNSAESCTVRKGWFRGASVSQSTFARPKCWLGEPAPAFICSMNQGGTHAAKSVGILVAYVRACPRSQTSPSFPKHELRFSSFGMYRSKSAKLRLHAHLRHSTLYIVHDQRTMHLSHSTNEDDDPRASLP